MLHINTKKLKNLKREIEKNGNIYIDLAKPYYISSSAYPTIFDFYDKNGKFYQFRFRHNFLELYEDDETLFSIELDKQLDGLISWEECCLLAFMNKVVILDEVLNEKKWINSTYINNILKDYM